MARGKQLRPDQIVVMLRQIEVQLAQGKRLAQACKEAGLSEQVVIGASRDHSNRVRPHSSWAIADPHPSPAPSPTTYPHHTPCSSLTEPGPKSRSGQGRQSWNC